MILETQEEIYLIMENAHLRILTEKTWDLHGRINDTINQRLQSSFSFCSHCSNHGRYCVVASSEKSITLEEREKNMVVLRDSLKDLHTILVFLQRVKTGQKRQREEAFGLLEESRKFLIERINIQCSENDQRENVGGVLEEIIKFVGDDENFKWNFDKIKIVEQKKKKNLNNGIFGFIVHSTRFGLEFLVMFAGIYTGFKLCENKRQVVAPLLDSGIHFDVFCGRG